MNFFTIVPALLAMATAGAGTVPQDVAAVQEAQPEDSTLQLVMYDVEDVLDPISPRGLTLSAEYTGEAAEKLGAEEKARRAHAMESLQAAIQRHLLPAWDRTRNVSQSVGDKVLAVSAIGAQQRWIEDFLGNLRTRGVGQVMITTTLYEVPRGTLKALGIESPIARLENDAALDAARGKIVLSPDCELISCPRLLCNEFQRGVISVMSSIAYIKEYEVKLIEPQKLLIADPVVDTVMEGYELYALAVPLPGDRFGVELEFKRTSIARPIPTKKVTIATDPVEEVEISMPEVTRVSLETSLLFDDGTSAIFATPANDEVHDLVVIVTVKKVTGEDLLREPKK